MWIYGGVMVLLIILAIGGRVGWIPYQKYIENEEWKRILLILLVGNLIGAGLYQKNNSGRILEENAWLQRPRYEQGNRVEQFLIETQDGEELAFSLSVPKQDGEEKVEVEKELSAEESFLEQVKSEVAALNEEHPDPEKYYLPSKVNGVSIQWEYPIDHSGTVIVSLSALAGLLLVIARRREEEKNAQARKDQLMMDYPGLVTKLCLLTQAGMTMRRAFSKTALDYRKYKKKEEPRHAYEEMLVTYYEMESGVAEGEAYENFGRRCAQVSYRTLATLLSQNLKKGSRGLMEMLERESVSAFEDRKRQAKILGEAAATKLLVPMVLMLLVVLAILMIPACLSFYG